MAVDVVSLSDERTDDGIAAPGPSNSAPKTLRTGSLRDQYVSQNLEQLIPSSETLQLPSPSPTPSPRSLSPCLVVTDTSSGEGDGHAKFMNGRKHSQSFETLKRRVQNGEAVIDDPLESPPSISKVLQPHELHDIPEQKTSTRHRRKTSVTRHPMEEKILKLSPSEMQELTSAEESLPLRSRSISNSNGHDDLVQSAALKSSRPKAASVPSEQAISTGTNFARNVMPSTSSRTLPAQPVRLHLAQGGPRTNSPSRKSGQPSSKPEPLNLDASTASFAEDALPSPPQDIPLPPLLSTYLQLELASTRPSPLYIHRSSASEYPYESSKVKFERLLNFLLLPPHLEQVLLFGALSCLDAWLHTFTILPLRFVKAVALLVKWWGERIATEAQFISGFIYHGLARVWDRRRGRSSSIDNTAASRSSSQASQLATVTPPSNPTSRGPETNGKAEALRHALKSESRWTRGHRRSKSQPSTLSSYHKADILQGLIIICSCIILMYFDASRMYHSIRGQSATKLYVIYNVLEVADRLFAALGQDIYECLLSDETLGRVDGRSKLLRPFWMFVLALIYSVIHATALLYQVITLNVAVNSYSNALLTLLMSNQFVEIKGAVFKKIEKQNLFQLTCADIVERFQLWLMLIIIGLRNIVEVGGLSIVAQASEADGGLDINVPLRSPSMLPYSFTILPSWAGEVLSPFLVVLGSELIVDWIKHSYISKFNNIKPVVYQKFLDVLAKDYYTNAFVNQNLIKRLGLPVIPLSCLFIRSAVQTYYMFLSTHLPPPIPSTATSLSLETEAKATPVTTAALEHFDTIIRKALGRSTFGTGEAPKPWYTIGSDDIIAFMAMAIFFLCAFLVLLACKLVLGMLLLRFARNRYRTIKSRENLRLDTKGRRLGVGGIVEVDDDKRRMIYDGDSEGAKAVKEAERKVAQRGKETEKGVDFAKIARYEMAGKRIW